MQSIRQQYGVPARRGREVRFRGESAHILSASRGSMHLWLVRPTLGRKPERIMVHPTWEMDYLDGRGVR